MSTHQISSYHHTELFKEGPCVVIPLTLIRDHPHRQAKLIYQNVVQISSFQRDSIPSGDIFVHLIIQQIYICISLSKQTECAKMKGKKIRQNK